MTRVKQRMVFGGVVLVGIVFVSCTEGPAEPGTEVETPGVIQLVEADDAVGIDLGTASQRRRSQLLSDAVSEDTIFLDVAPAQRTPLNGDWTTALDAAIAAWNGVEGSTVTFAKNIGPLNFGVRVFKTDLVGPPCAETGFPTATGMPADSLAVDSLELDNVSTAIKTNVLTHELGHVLGLMHFNQGNLDVAGTPASDASSIMNPGCNNTGGLSQFDKVAARVLYPVVPVIIFNSGPPPGVGVNFIYADSNLATTYELTSFNGLTTQIDTFPHVSHPLSWQQLWDLNQIATGEYGCGNFHIVRPMFAGFGGVDVVSRKSSSTFDSRTCMNLAAHILGIQFVQPNQNCIWPVQASGGSGSYAYAWYKNGSYIGSGSEATILTTSADFSLKVIVDDGFNPAKSDEIFVTTSSSGFECFQ